MTDDEQRLLDSFRRMDDHGKSILMRTAAAFTDSVIPFSAWKIRGEDEQTMTKEFQRDGKLYTLRDCTVNNESCIYLTETEDESGTKLENIIFNVHVSEIEDLDGLIDVMRQYPDEMSSYDDDLKAAVFV